jgi:hypothetical protein
LSPRRVILVADVRAQWAELDGRITAFDGEFVRWARENEDARRLVTIRGSGAIIASALVASVGRAEASDRARDLSAWLGIVLQQFTTGGKPKLLGISKRGNKYLRRQLIHGARAALPYVAERDTPLGRWAKALLERAHRNVALSPSPTSWPESPGRSCGVESGSSPQECQGRRKEFGGPAKRQATADVCERVTTRWPDSQTALRNPG